MNNNIRQAYYDKIRAEIKQWRNKIEQLKAKGGNLEAGTKIKFYQHIEEIQNKIKTVEGKLQQLVQAGQGSWDAVKDESEKVLFGLKESIDGMLSKLK
jgi:hypothetical protein